MSSHLFLTLDNDVGHELSKPLTDLTIDGTEDEYHQPIDKEPTDTDVEETLAQQKKRKVKVREAIKAIGREETICGEGSKGGTLLTTRRLCVVIMRMVMRPITN